MSNDGPTHRAEGGGTYAIPDGDGGFITVPGVTTILGATPMQGAFVGGALKKAYAALDACQDRDDFTYEDMRGAWYNDHKARDLGSRMHGYFEDALFARDPQPQGEDEEGHFKAFTTWVEDFSPKVIHSEVTVANLTWGYAGTLDLIAEIDSARVLMDFKTGYCESPYFQPRCQCSAYAAAEFIVEDDGSRTDMPEVDKIAVLATKANGKYKYRELPRDFDSFTALKHTFHALAPKASVCTEVCPNCSGTVPA